jgi:hypothetical protein
MEEMAGGWRRLHNEELCNLYALPDIIRVIKSKMRWTVHVAGWRRLHNEELCNLYASPNIIRMIKSKMRWTVRVACIKDIGKYTNLPVQQKLSHRT